MVSANLPPYLQDENEETILARMLAGLPPGIAKAEGSAATILSRPVATALGQAAEWLRDALALSFLSTTEGVYLDLFGDEWGIPRIQAVAATGLVSFFGTNGTAIPAGTIVTTSPDATAPALRFSTQASATVSSGSAIVPVISLEPGAAGNAAAGAVSILSSAIPGITAVRNEEAMAGGADRETDDAYKERLLQNVKNPSDSGNYGSYYEWVSAIPGVGALLVLENGSGPGTVDVYVTNATRDAAPQSLLDQVMDVLVDPIRLKQQAEDMTASGNGVSEDATQTDDDDTSQKLVYVAGANGLVTAPDLHLILGQRGIWTAHARLKVDTASGAEVLMTISVWNATAGALAKTTPSGSTDASRTLQGSAMATAFTDYAQDFYWNGSDDVELRVSRNNTASPNTTRQVWYDYARLVSSFSEYAGDGKVPLGMRVYVKAPTFTDVNVTFATVTIAGGFDADSVEADVETRLDAYLQGLAFLDPGNAGANDVRYSYVDYTVRSTPGIANVTGLQVNAGTADLVIPQTGVARLGSVTWP